MTKKELAALIDHTLVRADATQLEISRLCSEAVEHGLYAVTVNPAWTSYCAKQLEDAKVRINPTVGFPLGASTALIKVEEARQLIEDGATELDMVINVGALKSGFPEYVEREVGAVVELAKDVPVKVILEACYLTDDEKRRVCEISRNAGAAFVKTSTGFGSGGATTHDVQLMRDVVGEEMGVKAAGGIRTLADARSMIDAGATRLGTSASLQILAELDD